MEKYDNKDKARNLEITRDEAANQVKTLLKAPQGIFFRFGSYKWAYGK